MSRSDTKKRILDIAAREFAEYGYNGTSLRQIMRGAGVNVAAAHYHFGSKAILFRAVIDQFIQRIQKQRLALLDECNTISVDAPDLIERIFYALIAPHVRLVQEDGGFHYARIIARYASEPRELILPLYQEVFAPGRRQFIAALQRARPDLPEDDLNRSYGFAIAMMATSLVDPGYESLAGESPASDDPDALIDLLVSFSAAGFRGLSPQLEGVAECLG